MTMLNYESAGSRLPRIDERCKTIPLVFNEDKSILVTVYSPANPNGKGVIPYALGPNGNHVYQGVKVWDRSETKKIFYFTLAYLSAQRGIPDQTTIEYNQLLVLHRVGEFEGKGHYGYEFHEANDLKVSWVGFVNAPQTIEESSLVVKDLGDGTGIAVEYINGIWVEVGLPQPLVTTGGANFYGSPFLAGNLYVGTVQNSSFYVSRSGYGLQVTELEAGNVILGLDAEGRVVSYSGL